MRMKIGGCGSWMKALEKHGLQAGWYLEDGVHLDGDIWVWMMAAWFSGSCHFHQMGLSLSYVQPCGRQTGAILYQRQIQNCSNVYVKENTDHTDYTDFLQRALPPRPTKCLRL